VTEAARLHDAELFHVRLPLVTPLRAAHGVIADKEAILLRVRTDAGVGWGECAALSDRTYANETLDDARRSLRDELLPQAFAGAPIGRRPSAAYAALECALLDARLRGEQISLAHHLNVTRASVPAGVAVGFDDDASTYASAGYTRVKVKIEPGRDVDIVRTAHEAVGSSVALAADANGSYTLDGARALFAAFGDTPLQCVEQPLARDALADHAALVAHTAIPVCLDESITDAAAIEAAVAARACTAVSIKPARLGIGESVRAHDVCVANNIPALAGGMLETGIGRAVLVAVAAMAGFTLTGDCSASARYFGPDRDVTEDFTLDAGTIAVPSGPGIGVEPLPERLARVTVAHERITKD
jgi:o-succinylbenzoate synthase